MRILKFCITIFIFGLLLSSCSKEESLKVEKQIKADDFLMNHGFAESSAILDYAFSNFARGLNIVENFEDISSIFEIEPSSSNEDLAFWISKSEEANSFLELAEMAYDLGIVSGNQLNVLTGYDNLVFSEISEEEIISNIESLSTQIANSDELTSLEKDQLLQLNASIAYGLAYSPESVLEVRANGWGCAAGVAVTVTAGFITFNPLGVIAGAMIIDKYC